MDRFATYHDFDKGVIYDKLFHLRDELKKEENKDDLQRNADKEKELMFAQLMQGIKLNTQYSHRNTFY